MRVDDMGENIRRSDPGGTSALVTTGMPGVTNTSQFSKISFVATSVISLSPTITRGSVIHEFGREVNQANQCACNSREAHSCLFSRSRADGVGALRLALTKGEILAGSFVERDHQVVRRYACRRGDAAVDVFQECEPRLLRAPFNERKIEDNQVVGIMHAGKRRCVEKPLLRKFKDELVEVFGRHAKRVHQGRLDSAGHFGDPALVVTAFDNVDFSERHGSTSFAFCETINVGTMARASGQPLTGVHVSRENQDRRRAVWSEALIDRAAEALCKRFYYLESMPGSGICLGRAVVRDSAFDERQRWEQLDANRASAVTERVTLCIRDELRHDQTQPPAALGIHPECALHEPELNALAFQF